MRLNVTNSRKTGLIAAGFVLLLFGLLFAFQGAGYVGGSYMSGDPTYIYVGGVVAVLGLVLLVLGFRSTAKPQEPKPVAP